MSGIPRKTALRGWMPTLVVVAIFCACASDARADSPIPKSGWSYSLNLGFSNDNLPAPSLFAPKDRLDPSSSSYADDDGRTFGLVVEQALTHDRRGVQFVTSSWYEMLTEDGAQENWSRNRRADVLNNIFQMNRRLDLGSGWSFFIGMGLGVQTVGNLDGISLQSWWHENAGFGGRHLGGGLQDNYGGMRDSVTLPAMSQGFRFGKFVGQENSWNERLSVGYSALVALGGPGMSFGQVDFTGRVGHPKVIDIWAGVFISGGTVNDAYLSFAPIEHGALGYEMGISLNFLRNLYIPVAPTVTIQSNGSGLADTTFTVGFVIGHSILPWIRPPR